MARPSARSTYVLVSLFASMSLTSGYLLMAMPDEHPQPIKRTRSWPLSRSRAVGVPPEVAAASPNPAAAMPAPALGTGANAREADARVVLAPLADAPASRWTGIAVQCSGAGYGSAATLRLAHTRMGLDAAACHFVIGNGKGSPDGQIEIARRWLAQHPGYRVEAAGAVEQPGVVQICLIGDAQHARPTEAQLRELAWLVRLLQDKLGVPDEAVAIQGDAGRMFPVQQFRAQVAGLTR